MARPPRRRESSERRFLHIGTVAAIVLAVVGYISYNALNGLPLQRRAKVTVSLPDADKLLPTNDVRIANIRVGQVATVRAARTADGQRYAKIGLKLDPSVGQLPVDTIARARAASPLGATYVELTLGKRHRRIADGGTLPLSQGRPTVSVEDLFQIFSGHAKRDFQTGFKAIGDGLAGRGPALNATIGSVAALLPDLQRVSHTLAVPETRLSELLRAFATTAEGVAPARAQLQGLVAGAAVTFGAMNGASGALGATIDAAPGAEQAATKALAAVGPGLTRLALAARTLEPSARRLPATLLSLESALRSGIPGLAPVPQVTRPAVDALDTLQMVTRRPSTAGGLRKLSELFIPANSLVTTLLPAQKYCNILGLFTQNVGSAFGTLGSGQGPALGVFGLATTGQQGEQQQSAKPAPTVHINNDPVANADQCQSNNEPYVQDQQVLSPPVRVASNSARETTPPPGTLDRARAAGLLAPDPTGP